MYLCWWDWISYYALELYNYIDQHRMHIHVYILASSPGFPACLLLHTKSRRALGDIVMCDMSLCIDAGLCVWLYLPSFLAFCVPQQTRWGLGYICTCTCLILCKHKVTYYLLQIQKSEVDDFKKGKRIPSCQLLARCDTKQPTYLEHSVKLKGAKKPSNYFTIYKSSSECAL